jgi:hypothetical protein
MVLFLDFEAPYFQTFMSLAGWISVFLYVVVPISWDSPSLHLGAYPEISPPAEVERMLIAFCGANRGYDITSERLILRIFFVWRYNYDYPIIMIRWSLSKTKAQNRLGKQQQNCGCDHCLPTDSIQLCIPKEPIPRLAPQQFHGTSKRGFLGGRGTGLCHQLGKNAYQCVITKWMS